MNNLLHRIMYKLGYSYRYGSFRKMHVRAPKANYSGKHIMLPAEGNKYLADHLAAGRPFLVARIGSTELSALYNHYLVKNNWDEEVMRNMSNNSGFFPSTPANLERFCQEMAGHLAQVDLMGVWYNEGEEEICNTYCKQAAYTYLTSLEPYYFPDNPWSKQLAGKKVLVIHPFAASIQEQYETNRSRLFGDSAILPSFQLKTIAAVQSIAGNPTGFDNWFEAYHFMCHQIDAVDFDIALIGAGSYGLPLGSYAKQLGKQAIHMGGATQILFGLIGKRWEQMPEINKFFNSAWRHPSAAETPQNAANVEGGCYW